MWTRVERATQVVFEPTSPVSISNRKGGFIEFERKGKTKTKTKTKSRLLSSLSCLIYSTNTLVLINQGAFLQKAYIGQSKAFNGNRFELNWFAFRANIILRILIIRIAVRSDRQSKCQQTEVEKFCSHDVVNIFSIFFFVFVFLVSFWNPLIRRIGNESMCALCDFGAHAIHATCLNTQLNKS